MKAESNLPKIYLMSYLPKHSTIKVYTLGFPAHLKEKLAALALAENPRYNYEMYMLPVCSELKKICESWMPSLITIKNLKKNSDDTEWIVSNKPIDCERICQYLKIAALSRYSSVENASQALSDFVKSVDVTDFEPLIASREVSIIDENRKIKDNCAYDAFQLNAMESIIGKTITIQGERVQFFRCGRGQLMSQPFSHEGFLYSFIFDLSLQTVPKPCKAMLVLKISVRRFRSNSEKAKSILRNDMSVYVKSSQFSYQRIIMHPDNKFINGEWHNNATWDYKDRQCCAIFGINLPEETHVLQSPSDFLGPDLCAPLLCTISTGNSFSSESSVETGISIKDKYHFYMAIFDLIKEHVELPAPAEKAHKQMYHFTDKDAMAPLKLRERLSLNLRSKEVWFEIYTYDKDKELAAMLQESIYNLLGNSPDLDAMVKINIVQKSLGTFAELINFEERGVIEAYQKRIREIEFSIGVKSIDQPTGAFIVLPNYKKEGKRDPKHALRIGFANTNRLTQFITPLDDEQHSKEKLNNTVRDMLRQMGLTRCLYNSPKMPDCPIIAIYPFPNLLSICEKKVRLLPLALTFDIKTGITTVESPALGNGSSIPYYRACLEMAKLSLNPDATNITTNASRRYIEQKIKALENYYREKPAILIISADGALRNEIWPGISNKSISEYIDIEPSRPEMISIGDKFYSASFNLNNSQLRIIRLRANNEVPDYFTEIRPDDEDADHAQSSGIFKHEDVFYSLAERPYDKYYIRSYKLSKLTSPDKGFKEKILIEFYPLQLQEGDEAWKLINYVDETRKLSMQYAYSTNMPMPIHHLQLLKEYF